MKIVKILPSFERSLRKLSHQQREKIKKTLNQFNDFLVSGILPVGLGFKKINDDKYELRVDIRLRIILKIEAEVVFLVLVGDHNNIRRYLKNFR